MHIYATVYNDVWQRPKVIVGSPCCSWTRYRYTTFCPIITMYGVINVYTRYNLFFCHPPITVKVGIAEQKETSSSVLGERKVSHNEKRVYWVKEK